MAVDGVRKLDFWDGSPLLHTFDCSRRLRALQPKLAHGCSGESATLEGHMIVWPSSIAVTRKVEQASVRGRAKYEKLADASAASGLDGRHRTAMAERPHSHISGHSLLSRARTHLHL